MIRDELAELERALREAEPPDAGPARERARRVVLAAHARPRARERLAALARPRARRAAPLVWAAAVVVLATAFLTQRDSGPAQAVERIVREIVQVPAAPEPTPTPVTGLALPGSGRLLVSGSDGLFVVAREGRRERLGAFAEAAWSPHGLYVAATAGRTLSVLDPDTRATRWTLRPGGTVSVPRWSPDGRHLAYRAGGALRIVWGNGRRDVLAGREMAPVAPAWRPGGLPTVAWAANDGTVRVENADTAKVVWSRSGGPVRRLAWSPDGRRLLIAGRRHGAIHDFSTRARTRVALADGEQLLAAAWAPSGTRLALAVFDGERTEVRAAGRFLLSAPGRLDALEWSPDGRRLLAAGSGQWLLARASGRPPVAAVSVGERFGDDVRTHGWCC